MSPQEGVGARCAPRFRRGVSPRPLALAGRHRRGDQRAMRSVSPDARRILCRYRDRRRGNSHRQKSQKLRPTPVIGEKWREERYHAHRVAGRLARNRGGLSPWNARPPARRVFWNAFVADLRASSHRCDFVPVCLSLQKRGRCCHAAPGGGVRRYVPGCNKPPPGDP